MFAEGDGTSEVGQRPGEATTTGRIQNAIVDPLARMTSERRSVADEPDVSEWVDKPALAVRSPGHLVHLYPVTTSCCTSCECVRNECVWIVTEEFNAYRRHAKLLRALPAVVRWLAHKERRALNVQADDRTKIPELFGAECPFVPLDRAGRIRDSEHEGNDWRLW